MQSEAVLFLFANDDIRLDRYSLFLLVTQIYRTMAYGDSIIVMGLMKIYNGLNGNLLHVCTELSLHFLFYLLFVLHFGLYHASNACPVAILSVSILEPLDLLSPGDFFVGSSLASIVNCMTDLVTIW